VYNQVRFWSHDPSASWVRWSWLLATSLDLHRSRCCHRVSVIMSCPCWRGRASWRQRVELVLTPSR